MGIGLSARYCGLDKAIALLNEQYGVGTVEVKVVQSRYAHIRHNALFRDLMNALSRHKVTIWGDRLTDFGITSYIWCVIRN